jgi:hypothetical protein
MNKATNERPTVIDNRSNRFSSTKDLRLFLMDQMNGVAAGTVDPAQAKGITNIAQQIYNSLLIEVKMAKARSELGDDAIKSVSFDD